MTQTRKTVTPARHVAMHMAMYNSPQSLDQLVEVSGLEKPTVRRFIGELQAMKMVHVGAWARDPRGYPTIRQYKWGAGQDAVCPRKNETSAVRMAAIRAKLRQLN